MSTITQRAGLSLPHVRHITWPTTHQHQVEYGIELAVRLYSDYDEGDALDLIRVARPDLTIAEVNERVGELCHLSNLAAEAEHTESRGSWEVRKDDYASALTWLATAPAGPNVDDALAIVNGTLCNLCDGPLSSPNVLCANCAADSINDELARRRGKPQL